MTTETIEKKNNVQREHQQPSCQDRDDHSPKPEPVGFSRAQEQLLVSSFIRVKKACNMEYSTGDIAAARSLQFVTRTFLLRSHRRKMKGLYIVTRYLPFVLFAMDLYRSFIPNGNLGNLLAFQDNSNILSTFTDATSTIPGITRCYRSSTSYRLFIPFLLLSVFELELADKPKPSHAVFSSTIILISEVFSVTNVVTVLLLQFRPNSLPSPSSV
ncbi:uncharacterized protein F5147DRAFT_650110 [Suillus discolor]|uniref:Uncharacterized protein n=1 Tax=Suillus discolor TaxID=1912936 RepID=A0A9P7FES3_9AGAM|nr:uncharacterized protein F5147DRAFT_650110 [Suillus discolor]KAG2114332.1 hypothetical protein F5147DRAFT_650110 [Suillus discolor]